MRKIIDEFKISESGLIILTLDKKVPDNFNGKIRIRGKIYNAHLVSFDGEELDLMLRNIAIKTSEVGFIGKDVEFV